MLAILSLILEGRSVRWQLQQVARCGIVIGLMVLAYDCDYVICTIDARWCLAVGANSNNSAYPGTVGCFRWQADAISGRSYYGVGACLQIMIVTGYTLGLRVELIIPIAEVVSDG